MVNDSVMNLSYASVLCHEASTWKLYQRLIAPPTSKNCFFCHFYVKPATLLVAYVILVIYLLLQWQLLVFLLSLLRNLMALYSNCGIQPV